MNRFDKNTDSADNCVSVCNEYHRLYYKNTVPDSRVLVFLTGFCLGMVFFYFSGIKLIGEGRMPAALSMENISRLHDFDFNAAGLFEYVSGVRLGQLLFMLICAAGAMRMLFSYIILGCGGFELGIMMFTLVYQYGLKGLLLSVLLLVPHWIFFFAVFWMLFNGGGIGDKTAYHNYSKITGNGIQNRLTKVKKIAGILLLWLVGILSEVYINPEIIKKLALFFK